MKKPLSSWTYNELIASPSEAYHALIDAGAEIDRLRNEKAELLKTRNSEEMQKMIDYWGRRSEKAELEIERLRIKKDRQTG